MYRNRAIVSFLFRCKYFRSNPIRVLPVALISKAINNQYYMEKGSSNYPPCSQPACEVCGCALGYLDSLQNKDLDYSVCKSFTCQKVMINK
ncbi:MAG: hypothetical protein KAU21_06345, partial [Gammaproteobacteria bacterium]|nr:hypothetical protein [Gammaproteobacteria bacterium]